MTSNKPQGGSGSKVLSGSMSRLDYAQLNNDIAERIYAGALAALEQATLATQIKLMYINDFVRPVPAEEAKYPRRALDISLVFGGGLALYDAHGQLLGGVGVSGDSSCADHNIAWRTRNTLGLDKVPNGVSGDGTRPDNIVYDITPQPGQMPGVSAGGWGHPACSASATSCPVWW